MGASRTRFLPPISNAVELFCYIITLGERRIKCTPVLHTST